MTDRLDRARRVYAALLSSELGRKSVDGTIKRFHLHRLKLPEPFVDLVDDLAIEADTGDIVAVEKKKKADTERRKVVKAENKRKAEEKRQAELAGRLEKMKEAQKVRRGPDFRRRYIEVLQGESPQPYFNSVTYKEIDQALDKLPVEIKSMFILWLTRGYSYGRLANLIDRSVYKVQGMIQDGILSLRHTHLMNWRRR